MKTFFPIAVLLATAACASNQAPLGANFGASVTANKAAMIADPTPAEGAPMGDGAAVDLAVGRYKTDTVKKGDTGDFEAGDSTEEGGN